MLFKDYAESFGIEITAYDIKKLKQRLLCVKKEHQRAIVRRYCEIWAKNLGDEQVSAQNKGRFAANTFLRDYIEAMH